jgi:hypothetical protein
VHDFLASKTILKHYDDERPELRCTHPLVTLIEKLDAISRHYHRSGNDFRPEKFIRHYDDAAAVIAFLEAPDTKKNISLPTCTTLVTKMLATKDIRHIPRAMDEAFALSEKEKLAALEKAHHSISPMYWGERGSLTRACESFVHGFLENYRSIKSASL